MKSANDILKQLREQGSRMTKTRNFIVAVFQNNNLPLAELEIRERLAKQGIKVNKTTVYRELEHLKSKNIIKDVDFGDGKKRYELNGDDHHHHLICTNCKKVEEVHVEDDVSHIEQKINQRKNFKIINHSLEFFGLCRNCK